MKTIEHKNQNCKLHNEQIKKKKEQYFPLQG